MPKHYLTKFDDGGEKCKNDINYLRKHPECGIPFIQDRPFNPDNPIPNHKFSQINRDFPINQMDRQIPKIPRHVAPQKPLIGNNIRGAIEADPFTTYLPQDQTNDNFVRRLDFKDDEHLIRIDERGLYQRIGNDAYAHQNLIPSFEETQPIGADREPYVVGGDVPLEDFGAGTGINLGTDFGALPTGDPREIEEFGNMNMESINELMETSETRLENMDRFLEATRLVPRGGKIPQIELQRLQNRTRNATAQETQELISERLPPPSAPPSPPEVRENVGDLPRRRNPIPDAEGTELIIINTELEEQAIIDEAQRFIRRGRPTISRREAEQIANKYEARGVSRERVFEILEQNNLYDAEVENLLQRISSPGTRAMLRRFRAINEIIRSDTNFRSVSTEEEFIDIPLEDEPLIEQSRLSRVRPIVDRTAQTLRTNIESARQSALQNIRTTTTRMFGRQYAQIRPFSGEIDSALNTFDIDADLTARTEDITGLRANDIGNAEGIAPLEEEIVSRSGRPKLTFAENLSAVRRGAFSSESGIATAGGIAGAGAGFGIGILSNKAMEELGIKQNMATQTLTGGIAGAGGDVVARITSMASASALETAGLSTTAQTLEGAAARGFGRTIARGAMEGGVIGVALTPVDLIANSLLFTATNNHAASNVISTTGVGVAATGLAAWLAGASVATAEGSAAAAPETAGISLIPGLVITGIFATLGGILGANQDKKEKEARETIANIRQTSSARTELIKSLPKYKYNLQKAINNFPNKANLGIDDDSWDSFTYNLQSIFNDKPPSQPKGANAETTEEGEKINRLFSQQVTHYTIQEVCKKGGCSQEMLARNKGALSKKDYDWLNEKMAGTLLQQENLQIQLNLQTLKFTQKRIKQSQQVMLDSWNKDQKLITDPNTLAFAYTDPTWKNRFDTYAKLNAQYLIVHAYQTNQTTYNNMSKDIQTMANKDPEFLSSIRQYYTDMATTSRDLNISVPQLIQIQGTPQNQQQRVYEGFQFDNIKQDPNVVSDAQKIKKEEDAIKNGAVQFYDIDQAYILTDPHNIYTWNPSDAQILQAYNAGMTLREYVDYMHELAKGENGDFSRLPIYTQEQIKQFTDADIAHFQDELKMTGHEGLYTWDEQNRSWILHKSNNNVLSSQHYQSPFIPGKILKAREEYADMIHGLNEANQKSVDTFNTNLMKELTSYGRHYDSIVGNINDQRMREGRRDLLFYDVQKIYDENKIEFTPLSETPSQEPVLKEKYELSNQQYTDVKRNIESKNIKSPDTQQLETAVQEVKDAGTEEAMAS